MNEKITLSKSGVAFSPELPILLEAGPLLAEWLDGLKDAAHAQVCEVLAAEMQTLVDQLGIPGQVTVALRAQEDAGESSRAADQLLRLSVDGRVCRYCAETALWVYSWASRRFRAPGDSLATIQTWLDGLQETKLSSSDPRLAFLSQLCLEILRLQPGALLGEEQTQAYLERWRSPEGNGKYSELPAISQVLPILRTLLEQGISLSRTQFILETIFESLHNEYAAFEISERLIADLSGSTVQICIHPQTLKALTLAEWQPARQEAAGGETLSGEEPESGGDATASSREASYPDYFYALRDDLVNTLGLLFPDLRFSYDFELEQDGFAFQVNDLRSQTFLSLPATERLAPTSAETETEFPLVCHPETLAPCLRLAASQVQNQAGSITPLEFLALSLKRFLRQNASRLIQGAEVERMVDDLKASFPELIAYVRELTSRGKITRLLRGLVDEGVPLLNLPLILEAYLDYERLEVTAPLDWYLMDDQPDSLTEELPSDFTEASDILGFVRNRLKNEISNQYSGGSGEIEVFQLAYSDTESLVAALKEWTVQSKEAGYWEELLPEELHERLIQAIEVKLKALTASEEAFPREKPMLLTDVKLRPALRHLLRREYPELVILAYSELTGSLRVKRRDWIELGWSA